MKTLKIALAILAMAPSLAFAGGHGWGRHRGHGYGHGYGYGGYGVRYYVPAPVVYVPVRPACAAPVYQERAVNPVAIGIAAGLTTALIVATVASSHR